MRDQRISNNMTIWRRNYSMSTRKCRKKETREVFQDLDHLIQCQLTENNNSNNCKTSLAKSNKNKSNNLYSILPKPLMMDQEQSKLFHHNNHRVAIIWTTQPTQLTLMCISLLSLSIIASNPAKVLQELKAKAISKVWREPRKVAINR